MIHAGPSSRSVPLPPLLLPCAHPSSARACPVLIFNTTGKPRLTKFYSPSSPQTRAAILQRIFALVSVRDDTLCNFVELPAGFGFGEQGEKADQRDEDLRVIYRHYATLYFAFVVDQSESELGILDLIQVRLRTAPRRRAHARPPR
ncbi:hypothetical protein JCM21900_004653 [Sporobolomyces salmonicolor]